MLLSVLFLEIGEIIFLGQFLSVIEVCYSWSKYPVQSGLENCLYISLVNK